MTIYLIECLQSQAQVNITGWNLKLINRIWLDPIRWKRLSQLSWSCDFGWKVWMWGTQQGLDRTAADSPWGVCGMLVGNPPHICAGTAGGKPTINGLSG